MEEVLAILLIFGGATLCLLSFSPVGKALAERIRGAASAPPDPELFAELDHLREQMAELQERVDFTERMLTQQQHRHLQPGGQDL